MSEEIIIDGVNVAECEYYIQDYQRANNIEGRYEHCKDVCELNGDNYFYCKMNKNCYYKQLKRLQAENEENMKRLRELSKEERQLREGWHAQCEVIEALRKKNEELRNNLELMGKYNSENFDEVLRLRQALEEIREIAGDAIDMIIENDKLLSYVGSIYNKINEVLDEKMS